MSRAPRSDGIANREKVLAAALRPPQRDVTVPLSVIAEEVGVGFGLLYRHFRDRDALLDALQVRSIGMVLALVEEILATDAPGIAAVRTFLNRTVQHGPELFLPYHGAPGTTSAEYRRLDRRVWAGVSAMVARGVTAKTLRADL